MKTSWEIKKLEDICKLQLGKTPYRKDKRFWDKEKITNNVWLSISDLKHGEYISDSPEYITDIGTKGVVKIPKGTMLISFKLTLGRISFAGKDLYTNEAIVALLDLNKEVLKEYLFYYFSFFDWEKSAEGDIKVKGKTLNKEKLRAIKIPLPPLPEQKRIVSILDEAFAGIEKAKANAEQNLKNAKELFENYLQGVFENKGEGWEEKTLGDVCTLYQGIAINAKTKHALVEKSDLPLLRIKDLKNNTVEQFIDPNNYPKNALVSEEDIIYTRTGSLGLVFRGKKGVLHNNSFKVVPNKELDKEFLFIWLQNPIFKSKIMELALKAAQPDITHAIFKIQEIALPSIEQQQTIVRQLDALRAETQKLEELYTNKIADCEELKKSILHKAFAGEI